MTLSDTELSLGVGATQTLTATVEPDDAKDKTVTFTSSDETVATVSSNGEVTAIGEGATDITCSTVNGLTATCAVTVTAAVKEVPNKTWESSDIKSWLDSQGVAYPEKATKAKLLTLVKG
ncbi:Ig-like domain-containing protein [Lactococcus garvieae]